MIKFLAACSAGWVAGLNDLIIKNAGLDAPQLDERYFSAAWHQYVNISKQVADLQFLGMTPPARHDPLGTCPACALVEGRDELCDGEMLARPSNQRLPHVVVW